MALVAACRGPETPLAFLTFGNYSATGNWFRWQEFRTYLHQIHSSSRLNRRHLTPALSR